MVNISLRAVISELLSGFCLIAVSLGAYVIEYWPKLDPWIHEYSNSVGVFTFALFLLFTLSWIAGSCIDAIRNWFIEHCLDRKERIPWNKFFHSALPDDLERLEKWYFSFYTIDMNLAIAFTFTLLFQLARILHKIMYHATFCPIVVLCAVLAFIAFVFYKDARSLRSEIKTYMECPAKKEKQCACE